VRYSGRKFLERNVGILLDLGAMCARAVDLESKEWITNQKRVKKFLEKNWKTVTGG
jgi:hypothetical protein